MNTKRLIGATAGVLLFLTMLSIALQSLHRQQMHLGQNWSGLSGLTPISQQLSPAKPMTKPPYLIYVWSTSCYRCLTQWPVLKALQDKSIPIIGVAISHDSPQIQTWLAHQGNPFLQLWQDGEGNWLQQHQTSVLPTLIAIDRHNHIATLWSSSFSAWQVESWWALQQS